MESKKTSRADIEKERTLYFLMGFIVVLSSFFVLMEWGAATPEYSDWQNLTPVFVENEFNAGLESPDNQNSAEVPEEIILETTLPPIVYEGYQVTEDVSPPEELFADSLLVTKEEIEISPEITPPAEETELSDPVLADAEVMPQFFGGQQALVRFIYQHIEYPSAALRQRIEGRVWCSFVVNKDGSISELQVERGVYSFLDDEAIRVLNLMPNWVPGSINRKPVRVKVYVPIYFKR